MTKDDEIAQLREALGLFVSAFDAAADKHGKDWSIGYWEGVDPGLQLAASMRDEEAPKDSRFVAVVKYDRAHIEKVLKIARGT